MQVLGLSQFQREMCIAHRPAAFSVGASEMISQKRMHLPTRDRLTGCHACRDVASDQQDRRFRWWGEQENGSRDEHLEPPEDRKSTRLNSSHSCASRMQSSARQKKNKT